jgi:D-arabinose 1-dehydrogenase-like Zn-dependent alcohol dehydrogenase
VVDYQNAIVLPDSMDPKKSAPMFCAGITGKTMSRAFCLCL